MVERVSQMFVKGLETLKCGFERVWLQGKRHVMNPSRSHQLTRKSEKDAEVTPPFNSTLDCPSKMPRHPRLMCAGVGAWTIITILG